MAVVAMIPTPRDRTAVAVNPGLLVRFRVPNSTSRRNCSSQISISGRSPLHLVRFWMDPGRAIRAPQETVGFSVVHHAPLRVIPRDRSAKLLRDVGEDAGARRHVSLLD